MRRETPAFAQQKWPGGYLYHYGLCELAQRQAVFVRKDKPSDRAIKSDRAKVVMTAGCISKTVDISNYIYIPREIGKSEFINGYLPALLLQFCLPFLLLETNKDIFIIYKNRSLDQHTICG